MSPYGYTKILAFTVKLYRLVFLSGNDRKI